MYTKTIWVNNNAPAIDDVNLNHIEQGIFEAHEAVEDIVDGTTKVGRAAEADALAAGSVVPGLAPIGSIVMWPSDVIPDDYYECNGSTKLRISEASDLYAVIGTTFGEGDGSTTFNLPDMRGQFARGWDHNRGVDTGRVLGSSQEDELESHRHQTTNTDRDTGNHLDSSNEAINVSHGIGSNSNYFLHGTTREPTWGKTSLTGGSETRPKNIALVYIIKYK